MIIISARNLPGIYQDLPATGKDLPATGKDLPAISKDLPATGNESLPVICKKNLSDHIQGLIATNKARGSATKAAVHNIIDCSPVPLTINEIASLVSEHPKSGKTLSREYIRAIVVSLLAEKRLQVRTEASTERAIRGGSRRGPDQRVYTTVTHNINTFRGTQVKVPFLEPKGNRGKNKKQARTNVKAKTTTVATTKLETLLNELTELHTYHMQQRINKLEAKLAKIKAITLL